MALRLPVELSSQVSGSLDLVYQVRLQPVLAGAEPFSIATIPVLAKW
jgi:hypothetical protein